MTPTDPELVARLRAQARLHQGFGAHIPDTVVLLHEAADALDVAEALRASLDGCTQKVVQLVARATTAESALDAATKREAFYEQHTAKQANELVQAGIDLQTVRDQRDKWLAAFNRSEQFQNGPTKRAELAEARAQQLEAALKVYRQREREDEAEVMAEPVRYDTPLDHYRRLARRFAESRDEYKHRCRELEAQLVAVGRAEPKEPD